MKKGHVKCWWSWHLVGNKEDRKGRSVNNNNLYLSDSTNIFFWLPKLLKNRHYFRSSLLAFKFKTIEFVRDDNFWVSNSNLKYFWIRKNSSELRTFLYVFTSSKPQVIFYWIFFSLSKYFIYFANTSSCGSLPSINRITFCFSSFLLEVYKKNWDKFLLPPTGKKYTFSLKINNILPLQENLTK